MSKLMNEAAASRAVALAIIVFPQPEFERNE
jgi:hypothetical protein